MKIIEAYVSNDPDLGPTLALLIDVNPTECKLVLLSPQAAADLINRLCGLIEKKDEVLEIIRLHSGSEIAGTENDSLQSQRLFRIYKHSKEALALKLSELIEKKDEALAKCEHLAINCGLKPEDELRENLFEILKITNQALRKLPVSLDTPSTDEPNVSMKSENKDISDD